MVDYVEMGFELMLEELEIDNRILVKELIAETKFALESLEEGHIAEYVDEAGVAELKNRAVNALKVFLDKINSIFIAAAAKFYEHYAEKVDAKSPQIQKKAETASIDLAPYWKPNYEADLSVVKKIFDEAFKYPYNDEDIGFIKELLPSINGNTNYTVDDYLKYSKDNSIGLRNMVKNRFRFGQAEPDNNNIKKETLKGGDLTGKIDDMVKYVKNYKGFANNVRKTSDEWKNKAKNFSSQVQESVIAQDTVLMIEGCELKYTDLALLEGFDLLPLFEQDDGDGSSSNSNNDKGTGDEQKGGSGDLNKVEDNNKPDEDKPGENKDGENKPQKKTGSSRYNMCDKFCKLVYTSYIFSVEERFVVYIKAMETVLGESLKKKTEGEQGGNNDKDNEQQQNENK